MRFSFPFLRHLVICIRIHTSHICCIGSMNTRVSYMTSKLSSSCATARQSTSMVSTWISIMSLANVRAEVVKCIDAQTRLPVLYREPMNYTQQTHQCIHLHIDFLSVCHRSIIEYKCRMIASMYMKLTVFMSRLFAIYCRLS
jgi:hypothetical protein